MSFQLQQHRASLKWGGYKKLTCPTKNCCFFLGSILILELSRGGNSHQSETNLIKKTPEANLPGAPFFGAQRFRAMVSSFSKTFTPVRLGRTHCFFIDGIPLPSGHECICRVFSRIYPYGIN
jgi:hypothetical protein